MNVRKCFFCLLGVVLLMVLGAGCGSKPSSSSTAQNIPKTSPAVNTVQNTVQTGPAQPVQTAKNAFNQPVQQLPRTGVLTKNYSGQASAPFQIVTKSSDSHYYVKVVDASTQKTVVTVFIRGNETADLHLPLGTYELRYAAGAQWYGEQYLFGPQTSYNKADELFKFQRVGSRVEGYRVELYKQAGGNLSTSSLQANQF